jgi:hypothetical protein
MNRKEMVELIHKTALGDPPGVNMHPKTPTTVAPNTQLNTSHPSYSKSSTVIMSMQDALLNLGKEVSGVNMQDLAKSSDVFGSFLATNYQLGNIINVFMNDIKQGSKFVDGVWGKGTSTALHGAYLLASALLGFVDDLNRFADKKIVLKSYNKEYLKDLETVSQEDPHSLTQAQKEQAAPIIAKHLQMIANLYQEVKDQILNNQTYRQFIKGSQGLKTYSPKPGISANMLSSLQQAFPALSVEMPDGSTSSITVNDLVSSDSLQKWIAQQRQPIAANQIINQLYPKSTESSNSVNQVAEQPNQGDNVFHS